MKNKSNDNDIENLKENIKSSIKRIASQPYNEIREPDIGFLAKLAKEYDISEIDDLVKTWSKISYYERCHFNSKSSDHDDLLTIADMLGDILDLIADAERDSSNAVRLCDPDAKNFDQAEEISNTLTRIRNTCIEKHKPVAKNAPRATMMRKIVNIAGDYLTKSLEIPFKYNRAEEIKEMTKAGQFVWAIGRHLLETRKTDIRGLHIAACEYGKTPKNKSDKPKIKNKKKKPIIS